MASLSTTEKQKSITHQYAGKIVDKQRHEHHSKSDDCVTKDLCILLPSVPQIKIPKIHRKTIDIVINEQQQCKTVQTPIKEQLLSSFSSTRTSKVMPANDNNIIQQSRDNKGMKKSFSTSSMIKKSVRSHESPVVSLCPSSATDKIKRQSDILMAKESKITPSLMSLNKRKRSPSTLSSLSKPISELSKEEKILNDEQMFKYIKFICSTAAIQPTENIEEITRREVYAEYCLKWRVRRAIELGRMDIEQKFSK